MSAINKRSLLKPSAAILLSIVTGNAFAQQSEAIPQDQTNYLQLALIITAIVLVAVIWMLAQVLVTLSKTILKKRKGEMGLKGLIILLFSSILSSSAAAQENSIMTGMDSGKNFGGMAMLDFYALVSVIAIELVVVFYLALMTKRAFGELSGEVEKIKEIKTGKDSSLSAWWNNLDKKWFTKAIPVEKEADHLLDHDYDGIRELDNALPPWWKYGFYITIVVAFIYMYHYHVSKEGQNPEQEYAVEMEEGKKQEALYMAKTKSMVDENNITLSDASGIAAGQALYMQSCVACHAADGGGGIGPNLTDKNWIHGGSLNDIYKTIKIGYPEKGMQSWQSMYSPVQMKDLTSFVKSLVGTKPANPKEPQGEPYEDVTAAASTAAPAK
jgi:cytochrome c oxidase cbb3-type subunit III